MKKRADGRYQRKITLPDGTQKHAYGTSPAEVNRKAKEIERAFETGIDLSDRPVPVTAQKSDCFLTT